MLEISLRTEPYTFSSSADSRPYVVYTPANYQVGTATPLLVLLHGCKQTAEDFAVGTQMDQLAEQYGFIVLYPQQIHTSNRNLCWNWFTAVPGKIELSASWMKDRRNASIWLNTSGHRCSATLLTWEICSM